MGDTTYMILPSTMTCFSRQFELKPALKLAINRFCNQLLFANYHLVYTLTPGYNKCPQSEKEGSVETLAVILSIVASILSIAATIVALKSKKETQQLCDIYKDNQLFIKGDKNIQVGGDIQVGGGNNKVNTHDR